MSFAPRHSDELMLGPFLLAAPVVEPGERARRMYLPDGPACWFDFWTEEVLAPGAETIVAAPLDRLPLVVAEGGDPADDRLQARISRRLHDEPTRTRRIFSGPAAGCRRFMLFEDDGIAVLRVNMTRVTFDLAWTVEEITLSVSAEGDYPLPDRQIRVISRQADRRRIRLNSALGERRDFSSADARGGLCRFSIFAPTPARRRATGPCSSSPTCWASRATARATSSSTALGAAFAAGWQAGFYPGPELFAKRRRRHRIFTPMMDEATREAPYRGWREAAKRAL